MKFSILSGIIFIGVMLLVGYLLYYQFSGPSDADILTLNKETRKLFDSLQNHQFEEIDDETLKKNIDSIYIISIKFDKSQNDKSSKEKFSEEYDRSFGFPLNLRYWPQYYYSYPYLDQTSTLTGWPPGMYSKFYNITPGFNTSGWGYWLRPGVSEMMMGDKELPRGRWIRNNSNYYFVANSTFPTNNKLDMYY